MLEQNPVWKHGLSKTIVEWLGYDVKPIGVAIGRDKKCYVISCGTDGGDVTVNVFESEDELTERIDQRIKDALLDGQDIDHEGAMTDCIRSAVDSGFLVSTSLWG